MDFSAFDDLSIVSGRIQPGAPVTLLTIVHNEMFFLPAFLAHYRSLGIEQFVVLDDASTDGTQSFLAQQPDVVVVKSSYRYGDTITVDRPTRPGRRPSIRIAAGSSMPSLMYDCARGAGQPGFTPAHARDSTRATVCGP